MIAIQRERLLADLRTLAQFGAYKTGVHRPTFSDDDMAARRWLMGRLQEAGLHTGIDGVGNVYGHNPPGRQGAGAVRRVLSGSHLESQNHAGWLDGAMGVVFALEAARVFREHAPDGEVGVDVMAFCDEEGHFSSFLGSRSFTGELSDAEMAGIVGPGNQRRLVEALEAVGLATVPRQFLADDHGYCAFIEAHIEQGNTLELLDKSIGVVTSIVGNWQYRIIAKGEQNHAGTTMMSRRRDAGLALVRLLADIDRTFPGLAAANTVWTTGNITLHPGAKAIIPGHAEALFQFRDDDPAVLLRLEEALQGLVAAANAAGEAPGAAATHCPLTLTRMSASAPAAMDEALQDAIDRAAAQRVPGRHMRMPSGAGHDAQWLARRMPGAMLFVPSIGGISHHWSEDTTEADIVQGAEVFVDAIANIFALQR